MLGCTETLTLVKHIASDDEDRYACVPAVGASWYRKRAVALSESGAKPVHTCICRIPAGVLPEGAAPAAGDFLVRGAVAAVDRIPRDFGALDYMQVTAVGDNRRGRLGHWSVSGA